MCTAASRRIKTKVKWKEEAANMESRYSKKRGVMAKIEKMKEAWLMRKLGLLIANDSFTCGLTCYDCFFYLPQGHC
jgi:hypothetical protein